MATLVSFHAHPDDETIACGGTLAKAAAEGHRVVVVFATKGERGEVGEGVLQPGEQLWERRVEEARAAAYILGVNRVAFLGYLDSGMAGTRENDEPSSFWRAEVDVAASRLAAILEEEHADALTVYDENGAYGHPDHIQVHRVGVRAGELAGTPAVFEATMNRDHIRRVIEFAVASGQELPGDVDADVDIGVSEDLITTMVDVRPWLDQKRKAMAAHATQIAETSFFLSMPVEAFEMTFGFEWYIRRGAPPGTHETDLLAGR